MGRCFIKNAFSLIECMIYIAMFVLIAHPLISFVALVYKKHMLENHKINTILQIYSASDKLIQDIHSAIPDKTKWKHDTRSLSFYISSYEQVRWYIKDNTLRRSYHRYTILQKKWTKKVVSIAAQNISDMRVSLTTKGTCVSHIRIEITSPYLARLHVILISLYTRCI